MDLRTHHRLLAAAATLSVAFAPAAAEAATKTVTAGPPTKMKGAPEGADFNAFFPSKVTVAKGDSVSFEMRGFHTVTFSKSPPSLFTVNGKVTDQKDAAGNPFWFNGADRAVVNPDAGFPSGDGTVDGKGTENSGIPEGEKPKPYKLKFAKTGTYNYLCLVHPDMKGQVTVVKKGRKTPSKHHDAARVAKQVAKAIKTAKKLAAYEGPGGNNVKAGNDTKAVSMFRFFPGDTTVKAGETVRWTMTSGLNEIHTITFGPQDYLKTLGETFVAPDPASPQGGPPTLVVNPIVAYPSESPASGVPSYDGANHGNGFLNSGILDDDAKSPFAKQFEVKFTKAGTYGYLCIVHGPDMSGKVTVTQ
jgi:plastocyanin